MFIFDKNIAKKQKIVKLFTILSLSFSASLFSVASHAGYQEGVAAFEQNNYIKAYEELKPLGEAGDASSQYYVGFILQQLGHPKEALTWYQAAASQGNMSAQENLGVMYWEGKVISQNYIEAYKWLSLASRTRNTQPQIYLELLKQQMTPEEKGEAQQIVNKLLLE